MTVSAGAWQALRGSSAWRALRRVGWLRHIVYAVIELHGAWRDVFADPQLVDEQFRRQADPWNYGASPVEQARLAQQAGMLDAARAGSRFANALEVGCGEGMFTELLAPRCNALRAVDVSETALERARMRRFSGDHVRFARWDLRRDPLEGKYDLLVVTCVLEYIRRPRALRAARNKIVDALVPGGYLLVVSTRANDVVENSWLASWIIRGASINALMAKHPSLRLLEARETSVHAYALFQKPSHGA